MTKEERLKKLTIIESGDFKCKAASITYNPLNLKH